MTARIIEIISRSAQGVTRPFFCKAADGKQYYIKGAGAGRRALISEWIAGRIGQRLGLPIPAIAQCVIAAELIELSARDDLHELGAGTAFGSQVLENVDELPYLFIEQVPEPLRATVLLFDWWVCNGDRTLTENGGNVNLLWNHGQRSLHVIDHNLAFDEETAIGFWDQHVFRDSWRAWDEEFRRGMTRKMEAILREVPDYWREMPGEWTELDSGIALEQVVRLLSRFVKNPGMFWERHD
jgi:hypothetical protein